jgi:outer membrane immunogenic protein
LEFANGLRPFEMKKSFVSVLFFGFLGAAHAADMPAENDPLVVDVEQASPAQPSADRWAGAYVGISAGHGWLTDSAPAEGDDSIYGAFAGYNLQWGPVVIGAEVGGEKADIMFTDGSTIASKYMYGARLRGGLANDYVFAYGSVGVQHGVTNEVPFIGLVAPMNEDTALQLGAGVDVAVTKNVALGLDFTYTKYEKFGDFTFFGTTVDVETKKLLLRLSYKFN